MQYEEVRLVIMKPHHEKPATKIQVLKNEVEKNFEPKSPVIATEPLLDVKMPPVPTFGGAIPCPPVVSHAPMPPPETAIPMPPPVVDGAAIPLPPPIPGSAIPMPPSNGAIPMPPPNGGIPQ